MDGCGEKGGTQYKVLTFGAEERGREKVPGYNDYNLHLTTKSRKLMKYQLWYADINGHIRSAAFPKFLFYVGLYNTIKVYVRFKCRDARDRYRKSKKGMANPCLRST